MDLVPSKKQSIKRVFVSQTLHYVLAYISYPDNKRIPAEVANSFVTGGNGVR